MKNIDTKDRLFGLYITMKEKRGTILIKTRGTQNPSLVTCACIGITYICVT